MIKAVGIAFTAIKTEANTKTKQQLEAEESIGQQSDTATSTSKTTKATDTSSIKDMRVSKNNNETTVLFADPTNGNLVKLNLSNENIEKLKQYFTDESDFYTRKDGTTRLNGDAEVFVSGWFGDIAYKREFIKADGDGDGRLSEEEYQNTRNGYVGAGIDTLTFNGGKITVIDSTESIEEAYVSPSQEKHKKGTVRYNDGYKPDSIEDELNTTIRIDSDFDLSMTLSESYHASSQNTGLTTSQIVTKHIDEYYTGKLDSPYSKDGLDSIRTLLEKSENKQVTEALQKLRAANGDESVLSTEEKKALGAELQAVKKQLQKQLSKEDDLSSIKQEIKDKVENTQFIDVKG